MNQPIQPNPINSKKTQLLKDLASILVNLILLILFLSTLWIAALIS